MHKSLLIALSLTCALALSGCAPTGKAAKTPRPECPLPQPPDPSLMTAPSYADRVRALLFSSESKRTRKSGRSRPR